MSRLVAHRGQNSSYPENTLESIAEAIQCGALAVEFDVQMTKDHIPVVCHDVTLFRTAGIDLDITRSDYAEIENICVGEPLRFADQFQSATLPSLAEIVKLIQQSPQLTAFVEIKEESLDAFGVDVMLERVITELGPVQHQCVLIADNLQALLSLRALTSIPIGWIIHNWDENNLTRARQSNPDYMIVNYKYCTSVQHDFMADRWRWVMYETSDPETAKRLFGLGIDFVETNNICSMLEQLSAEDNG